MMDPPNIMTGEVVRCNDICQKPWTKDIVKFTSKLVKERIVIKPGHPLFSLILLDCEVIVYLDISDGLLRKHCQQRNALWEDAKNVKYAIEGAINERRMSGNLKIYDLEMDE